MYTKLIERADGVFAMNRQARAQSDKLRSEVNALLFTYRGHRFPHLHGASVDGRLREFLRDLLAGGEGPKSFVGPRRGSVCQACGKIIKPGEIEYDVAVGTSELRLDVACHGRLRAESETRDPPDAARKRS